MDPEVHRGRNGAAGENRVRKLGSVLTLDIFQKGQATRRISIVRTDPFSSFPFRGYLGQAARSFAAMSLYSASDSFLLGAGVPGAFPPKEGMT